MVARIIISDYIKSSGYNINKLDKLEKELKELCFNFKTNQQQQYPKDGILINVSMSAKYGKTFVKVSQWGRYQSVGEFEYLVKEALGNRGFEVLELDGNEDSFNVSFE